MAIVPTQFARVSTGMQTDLVRRSILRTQQSLLEAQQQISTGRKLTVPSQSPADASAAMRLRKALETQETYAANLRHAAAQMGAADTALEELSDVLRQALQIASANASSTVSADERAAAATVVASLYNRAMDIANRQSSGMYLFAGDGGGEAPYAAELGGVRWRGSEQVLANRYSDGAALAFMVDGTAVFGGASDPAGTPADLSPRATAYTRLGDLAGARGEGVSRGTISISDGSTTAIIDLSSAETLGDVISAINSAGVGGIAASLAADGMRLELAAGSSGRIVVRDVTGTAAADLGIVTDASPGAGVSVEGEPLNARVTPLTLLADLRGGSGLDLSGFTIVNGPARAQISLSGARTVEDLLNAINASGTGAAASIGADGRSIVVRNTVQGSTMTVAEGSGQTASQLGMVETAGVSADGVFAGLGALRDALVHSDIAGITAAAEMIQQRLDACIRVRGEAAAQAQDFDARATRLEDEKTAMQALLSNVEEADLTEAIVRFQTLQNALQASVQTAGHVLNMSLLDFLD